jgi:hypothetical protein
MVIGHPTTFLVIQVESHTVVAPGTDLLLDSLAHPKG